MIVLNLMFVCLRCGKQYLPHELKYSKQFKKYYCSVKDCGYTEFEIIRRRNKK